MQLPLYDETTVKAFRDQIRALGYLGPIHRCIPQYIDAEDQFNLGGIPLRDILQDAYACGLYLLLTFSVLTLIVGPRQEKKVAWILSLITSVTELFFALPVVFHFFTVQGGVTNPYVYRSDDNAQFSVIFFMTFMVMDLVLGNIFYPKRIDLLSGYIHHAFYLWLLSYALNLRFSNCFVVFLPLEVPTALLALGSIFPSLRSDYLFGFSFFLCRILYHGILMIGLIKDVFNGVKEVNLALPCFLAFILHIHWITNWIQKYLLHSDENNKKEEMNKTTKRENNGNLIKAEGA